MTPRVWIERPIESVEDAEALPVGSFVFRADTPWIAVKQIDELDRWESKNVIYEHEEVVGETALVPVEAVEETRHEATADPDDPDGWGRLTLRPRTGPLRRRLCTPWEAAD